MKFAKKLMCVFVIFTLTVPYAVYAEGDAIRTGETITVNFYDNKEETSDISLNSAGDEAYELSEQEVKFVNYIAEDIAQNHAVEVVIPEEYTIDSSRFDSDLVGKIVAAIQEDYPEIFYIREHFTAYYSYNSNGLITSVFLENPDTNESIYSMTDEEIDAAWDEINTEVDKIVAEAELLDTDLEKILYVHDYIVSNYKYDERVYHPNLIGTESRTLYSMVHEKTGVCQGYTYLFMTVMRELGIDCIAVPSDELNHIWNKVRIDGEWYNIDLTSDDPISDLSISISHDYFLLNDEEIKKLDPSDVTVELFLENEDSTYTKLVNGQISTADEDETYKITNGDEVIIESGTLSINEHHQYIISDGTTKVLYQSRENSHHYTWNEKNWDGTDTTVSDSVIYSESPLHDIKGKTIYYDDKFICVDKNNNICIVTFGEEGQTLVPIYTPSSEYVWRVYSEKNRYYQNIVSALELYYGKIYFNSPNAVYELNPKTGAVVSVYDYETENPDKTDESKTYFYGLQMKEDKLYAEYSENARTADLIEIPIEIIEPISDPIIEPTSGGDVTVTIDIPESRAEEVTVYIAEYDDNGALIRLVPQTAEGNVTEFTPGDEAKTIKAFIWGENNEPIANDEYEIPKVTLKAENLDDAKTDISAGTLYFYPEDTAGASTKYEIDSDAEWSIDGVKLTDEVIGSYSTVAEYAYNEFILGRYNTVTLRKTGSSSRYNKIVIDTRTTAVVEEYAYPKNLAILKKVYKHVGGDYIAIIIDKTGEPKEYILRDSSVELIKTTYPEANIDVGEVFSPTPDKCIQNIIEYAVSTSTDKLTIRSFIGSEYYKTETKALYTEAKAEGELSKIGDIKMLDNTVILDISNLSINGVCNVITPDMLVDGQLYTAYSYDYGYDDTLSGEMGYRFILITDGLRSYNSKTPLAVFLESGADRDENETIKVLVNGEEYTEVIDEDIAFNISNLKSGDVIVYITDPVSQNVIDIVPVFKTAGFIADNLTFADFRTNVIYTASETVQNGELINSSLFQTDTDDSILTDGLAEAEIVAGIVTGKRIHTNDTIALTISPVHSDGEGYYIDLNELHNYEDLDVDENVNIYTYTYAANPKNNIRFSTDDGLSDITAITPLRSETEQTPSGHEIFHISRSEYQDDIQFVFVRIADDKIMDIYRIVNE